MKSFHNSLDSKEISKNGFAGAQTLSQSDYFHMNDDDINSQPITIYWPWDKVLTFIRQMKRKSTDCLDYSDPTVNCSICKKCMEGEF
mmetsp:Transcript_5707/g.5410  ORF Transcript_5707/g.5410 Transcript_5707/m.5410 type:complete len:87 (-) Transcript_5707:148-408(-)